MPKETQPPKMKILPIFVGAFLRSIGEVLGKSFVQILVTCLLIIFTTDFYELVP